MPTVYVQGASAPFNTHMTGFINQSAFIFNAYAQDGQRRWMVPDAGAGWNYDVNNQSGNTSISKAFDRADLNRKYIEALNNGVNRDEATRGRVAETKCAKFQIDNVAAMERAFRVRTLSYVRAGMHSAARRKGHGDSRGVFGDLIRIADSMISAANVDQAQTNQPVPNPDLVADLDTNNPNIGGVLI